MIPRAIALGIAKVLELLQTVVRQNLSCSPRCAPPSGARAGVDEENKALFWTTCSEFARRKEHCLHVKTPFFYSIDGSILACLKKLSSTFADTEYSHITGRFKC